MVRHVSGATRPTAMPVLKTRAGVMSSSQHLAAQAHFVPIAVL
jgi:hypothetical protein